MRRLITLLIVGLVAQSASGAGYRHEYNKAAQIAFDLPTGWTVDSEPTLVAVGFIVPPEPLYALVAAPTEAPASVALNASAVPWLFVTVETDSDLRPDVQSPELDALFQGRLYLRLRRLIA